MNRHPLSALLEPRSIALYGATDDPHAPGRLIRDNIRAAGYRGRVGLINPRHRALDGEPCHGSARTLGFRPDLAIAATPAHALDAVLEDCAASGIGHVLVLSPAYSGDGDAALRRRRALLARARSLDLRLLGPGCLGLIRPSIGLNASMAPGAPRDGRVALVSQSGAMLAAMIDWALPAGIGFSSMVALGSAIDLDVDEVLDWLLFDERTESVLMYVEGVRDARGFMSGVRALARAKPVVILKAMRVRDDSPVLRDVDVRARPSPLAPHADVLVGNDRVFDAAIARAGAVRVQTSMQLIASVRLLAMRRRPAGHRLAIVTNGRGPGVLAADAAARLGLELARLSDATVAALARTLPAHGSFGNPVDVTGDAGGDSAERLQKAIETTMQDPAVDIGLVLFVPQAGAGATAAAQSIAAAARAAGKPVAAVLAGGASVAEGQRLLDAAAVPHFLTPENAMDAIALLEAFSRNQRALRQVPTAFDEGFVPDVAEAHRIRDAVLADQRLRLTEVESKRLLRCFGIASPPEAVAADADEAAAAAERIGFPVVLKILSPDIPHKSDVGGVRINVHSAGAARAAATDILDSVARMRPDARIVGVVVQPMTRSRHQRELYVGVSTDPVFGAVIAFGAGGVAVEQIDDVAIALPPLNSNLAQSLIAAPRIARLLRAYRSVPPIDFESLEQLLLRFSALVCACPWIRALDVNPVLADEHRAVVLDARVELAPQNEPPAHPGWRGAYGHLAIHPYPRELEQQVALADGSRVLLRPIRPEDAQMERDFVASLSRETLYRRFMMPVKQLPDAMIERFTQIDYDRELALVAIREEPTPHIVGVARIVPTLAEATAEFAIVIADALQRSGLGRQLMARLFDAARERGYRVLEGMVLAENRSMLRFCQQLGFEITVNAQDPAERIVRKTLG